MTRLDETATGVFTIAATPFLPDGALDLNSIDRMVDFYAEKGATGLTILGMMGEAGKLSADESVSVIRRVVSRTDMPVVVGVSAPGLAAIGALARAAVDLGAAGVMVAPPWTLKTDGQIVSYFHDVAEALGDIPFVLQDFPLATSVVMPVDAILKIVADCPTCVMLKHEDWPGLDKISSLRAASDAGARRISILCGNAGLFLPEELARGADGAMTGFAYPEMMAEVVAAHRAGERERAMDIFDAYLPLVRYESQPGLGLAVRKYVLARRGAIAHDTLRKPGKGLTSASVAEVERLMARLDRRLKTL
ncbi:dihydrodipicolinate synthase family protein [Sedimentitalea arenosa]|uniref:Dihydrodipicolinate synthase family protein n=1 Tax=Sedimentitalea arenosa TaxID=2798803 RepID=A0A8J7IMF4_9RHOB|nr:dihydrodipicolinate synthase family protein [Arenibacterium arenosum]MBJ6370531.1 dihydrodipicolinate synthase family protein [Arenibacterium arenosum]